MPNLDRVDDATVYWAGQYYPCPSIAAADYLFNKIEGALQTGQHPFVPWAWYEHNNGTVKIYLPDESTINASAEQQDLLRAEMLLRGQVIPTVAMAHRLVKDQNQQMDDAVPSLPGTKGR